MQAIISTLMDVAQAESGLMKLPVEDAYLRSLVADVVELYEHIAQEKEVTVVNDVSEPLRGSVDPARICQVFANLLDNAIKYTPAAGRISISSRRADGNVEVNFGDTGPGIREADLPRIWERLYRTDKSRSEHGLGLGLSVVKAIVEVHQGRVEVTSKEGKGSEFRISLPVGEAGDTRAFDGL